MTYAGLTIADKDALLDAKENGSEWVARDMNMSIYGYAREPEKTMFGWHCDLSAYRIEYLGTMETLSFVGLHEKANIELALAQIAEMEKKLAESGCEFCKHYAKPSVVIWDSHVLAMVGEDKPNKPFIKIELKARKNEAELVAISQGVNNKQNSVVIPIRYCPNCGRNLASPHTEGDKV